MNIPFNVKTARKQIKVWTNVAKDLKTLRLWTSWDFLVHLTLGQRCGRCNIYWDGTTHQVSSGEEWSWVSRKAQQSLILHVWKMGSSLIQVWLLFFWLDSQALHEIVALPTQKINFFYLSVIFYIKDCNSVDQSRNCRCERQLPPHYWNLWSSVKVPEAELISVLRSAPELEIWTHNTPGWIPALSSPWLFTLTGYETLQDLSLNAKLISYLGSTTVSSSCRHNTISEARVKLLKKSTVTTTMTE